MTPALKDAFVHCETLLRDQDRTSWLASLFAPAKSRPHIQALYAFASEIDKIPSIVSEPALGEIRLQWWSEVVEGQRAGEAVANPVSAALSETIKANRLPAAALANFIAAKRFDLYADPMASLNDLEGYCGDTHGALFRLASIILCEGREPGGADTCGLAGAAAGLTRILADLPRHAARGQCYVPKDVLERHGALVEGVAAGLATTPVRETLRELRDIARRHMAAAIAGREKLDKRAHPALVPLSLVAPLLNRMERRGYEPFTTVIELPQWRSQWAMWRW